MLCESSVDSYSVMLTRSLNPCYSGICSVSAGKTIIHRMYACLNPCYSGICSVSMYRIEFKSTAEES